MKFKIAFLTLLLGMGIVVFAEYGTGFMEVGLIDWLVFVGWLVMTGITIIFVWEETIQDFEKKNECQQSLEEYV